MVEGAAIMAALLGPEVAVLDGPGALSGRLIMGARGMAIAGGTSEVTRNQIAERILGIAARPADQLARGTRHSSGCEAWCAARAEFWQGRDAHPARH